MRFKNRWHQEQPRTLEDIAGLYAFYLWRIAAQSLDHLTENGIRFDSIAQSLAVMAEYLAFLIAVSDRWVYERQLSDSDRQIFMKNLAQRSVHNLMENLSESGGSDFPAEKRERSFWVAHLNQQLAEYAECAFNGNTPGYSFFRLVGQSVGRQLAETENRWVIEQTADIEAPEMINHLKKAFEQVVVSYLDTQQPS